MILFIFCKTVLAVSKEWIVEGRVDAGRPGVGAYQVVQVRNYVGVDQGDA